MDEREVDWPGVRRAMADGVMTRSMICRHFGISRGELERRIRDNRWNMPARDDRGDLDTWLDRFFAVLERVLDHMEVMDMGDGTKESAALQRLARTLDNLLSMRDRNAAPPEAARETREMQELRKKIARRLDELDAE